MKTKSIEKVLVFDTETTGVDVFNDRIVTAFIGLMNKDGSFDGEYEVLINPGVDIPEGATEVHGISTEHARENGIPPEEALKNILAVMQKYQDVPLVIYNAPFDLTLLATELKRFNVGELPPKLNVIDPLVIDKGIDKYRKGKRQLTVVAPIYGIPALENAHDAKADCQMTGQLAFKILEKMPDQTIEALQKRQVAWKFEQTTSLRKYFTQSATGDPETVEFGWPFYDKLYT